MVEFSDPNRPLSPRPMWAVTATSTATCRHVRLGQTCPFVNFDLSYLDEFCEFFYAASCDVDQNVEICQLRMFVTLK